MTTDEERWAQAEGILRDGPGPNAQRRIRKRKVLFWSVFGGSGLLGAAAVFVVLLLTHPHLDHHARQPQWQAIVGLILAAAGAALAFRSTVVVRRARQGRNPWHSPQAVLSRDQRRELSRQVSGKAAVDPARLPLTRDLAQRLAVSMRGQLLLLLAMVLTWAGLLLLVPSPFRWLTWLYLAAVALWLVGIPLRLVLARRAQRFLAEHPAEYGGAEKT